MSNPQNTKFADLFKEPVCPINITLNMSKNPWNLDTLFITKAIYRSKEVKSVIWITGHNAYLSQDHKTIDRDIVAEVSTISDDFANVSKGEFQSVRITFTNNKIDREVWY